VTDEGEELCQAEGRIECILAYVS